MERKIKYRLLGMLVIAGLVIILLPLFQSNKEVTTETTALKAPPFPEQSADAAAALPPESTPETQPNTVAMSSNEQNLETASNDEAKPQPEAMMGALQPSVINAPTQDKPAEQAAPLSVDLSPEKANQDKTLIAEPKQRMVSAQSASKKITKKNPAWVAATPRMLMNEKLENNGLVKLKNAVWVIQLGSFKNKTNALRLVNQLRANGYRAFIQQMWTTREGNTRVFVGPINQQTAARTLVSRIEADMHIRGIVISYQPLAL